MILSHPGEIESAISEIWQIYIPMVNWLQLAVVLIAVVGFGSSENLAAASASPWFSRDGFGQFGQIVSHARPLNARLG